MTNTVVGIDISFWNRDVDFYKLSRNADFVILRAGQNKWIDPTFIERWKSAKEKNIPRGSYWFYDSRVDPKTQVMLWLSVLGDDLGELPLFADFEEKYNGQYSSYKYWIEFLEELKLKLNGKNKIYFYTNYYYFNEKVPESDFEYFSQYPLWIARYNATSPLIPKAWTTWEFWQYAEYGDAKKYGLNSDRIDLNFFNGDIQMFRDKFNLPEPVTESFIKNISYGIGYIYEKYAGASCHICIIDPKYARFHVSNIGFASVSQAAKEFKNAKIVTNLDGWGLNGVSKGKPNSLACSDGTYTQIKQFETRPWFNFSKEGKLSFGWKNSYSLYNAGSGDRFIVENGKYNSRISDRTKDARTVFAETADGEVLLLVVDGWNIRKGYEPVGLAFYEIAEMLITDYNCVTAINLDGGGSSAMAINGKLISSPNDDGEFKERSVVNHLVVYSTFNNFRLTLDFKQMMKKMVAKFRRLEHVI